MYLLYFSTIFFYNLQSKSLILVNMTPFIHLNDTFRIIDTLYTAEKFVEIANQLRREAICQLHF